MISVRRYTRRRARPIQISCPIETVSAGRLEPGFFVYKRSGGTIPIPEDLKARLLAAKGPQEIERLIAEAEPQLAALDGRDFLDCDEAANLMSATLRAKRIPHLSVIGESDEGSSHAYVIVRGRRYDPTKQGYGSGKIESAERVI